MQIVVVDNHSAEDPSEAIRARWPAIQVIRTERNLGYGGGNNVGLREAIAREVPYALLLNNDVTVAPDTVRCLVEAVSREPRVGMATATVLFHDRPDHVYWNGGTIDWNSGETTHDSRSLPSRDGLTISEWLDGCALLVRTEILSRVGLLDDRYFLYYEDADWSLRSASLGWSNVVVAGSRVWHKVSRTTGGKGNPAVEYYYARNGYLFLRLRGGDRLHAGWKLRYGRHLLAQYALASDDRARRRAFLGALLSIIGHRWGAMVDATRPIRPVIPLLDATVWTGLRIKRLLWRATRTLRASSRVR